jgi:hypothetical protein
MRARSRREGDAAQDFGEAGGFDRPEMFAGGKTCRRQTVGDHRKPIGIGALIAAAAHRRGDGPDRCCAVTMNLASDVTKTVRRRRPWKARRGILARRISGDRVRRSQVQPRLQDIGEFPFAGVVVENPFLQASRGLGGRGGIDALRRVESRRAIALVGDIERLGIGEPETEGKGRRALGRGGEAFQHAHVVGNDALGLQISGVVDDRRRRQARRRAGEANTVWASKRLTLGVETGGIDEVDSIYAVAAAPLLV